MRKKVLFITIVNPFTATFGAEQRSYVFLQSFLQNGCEVDVAYLGQTLEDRSNCPQNVRIVYWNEGHQWGFSKKNNLLRLATIRMFPVCDDQEQIIDRIVEQNHYDYIACRYLPAAAYCGLFKYSDRLLLDIDDMPAQAMAAQMEPGKWYKELYHRRMVKSAANETERWINKAKTCFLPNHSQADYYRCTFLPNIPLYHADKVEYRADSKAILFIGLMSFGPNKDGVNHFIRNCWDSIVDRVPEASFIIAGKGVNEEMKIEWESHRNITVLGFVESVADFYQIGNIVVVPVYSGAGTNIKVIEALSLGKATVLTPFSTKGYENILDNGNNTIIAKTDKDYSDAIVKLLRDGDLCRSIANNGHLKADEYYSQRIINSIIERSIK